MAIRRAHAVWEGNLDQGRGTISVGDDGIEVPCSFAARFEDGAGDRSEMIESFSAVEATSPRPECMPGTRDYLTGPLLTARRVAAYTQSQGESAQSQTFRAARYGARTDRQTDS